MNPNLPMSCALIPPFSPHFQVEIQRRQLLGIDLRRVTGFANPSFGFGKPDLAANALFGLADPDQLCVNVLIVGRC